MLVSAIQQCQSAIIIHIYSPSWAPYAPTLHPSKSSQSTRLASLCYIAASHQLSSFHLIVYIYIDATFSIHSTLSFPNCVYKSILYFCIFIPSLQIGSSIPFFSIPYIWVNTQYLFFSFWLTSLCITGSKFIYLAKTDSDSFLFMANIPVYVCTTTSLSTPLPVGV